MLSGQRAFRGKSDVETMNAIVKEEPPDLAGPEIPHSSALQRIHRHCLEKNPQERYQSASDIAFDLEMLSIRPSTPSAPQAAKKNGNVSAGSASCCAVPCSTRAQPLLISAAHPPMGKPCTFRISPPEKTTFPGGQVPAISPDGRASPSWPKILRESLNYICEHSIARVHKRWMEQRALWQPFGLRTVASSDILPRANSKRFQSVAEPPQPLCDVAVMGRAEAGAGTG